jgi:hypothetical protein
VLATTLKSLTEYFNSEQKNQMGTFSNDAINILVILPTIVNIWKIDNNPIYYGVYFSITLGCINQYIARLSSDSASYIMHKYRDNENYDDNIDYKQLMHIQLLRVLYLRL